MTKKKTTTMRMVDAGEWENNNYTSVCYCLDERQPNPIEDYEQKHTKKLSIVMQTCCCFCEASKLQTEEKKASF